MLERPIKDLIDYFVVTWMVGQLFQHRDQRLTVEDVDAQLWEGERLGLLMVE